MSDPLGVVGVVLAEKFRVDRLLGEGGFGVVYAGIHLVLGEPIAVKFIKVEGLASDPVRGAEEYLREARILFSLSHPAIVRMYDVGALDRGPVRLPWVVLELLSGQTLEQEIKQRRRQGRQWSAAELRETFEPLLDGLAFAHARGIMHRDIKPSNIVLSRAPSGTLEPKLLDFGTARSQVAAFQTSVGRTGFTPLYGAPEQWDPTIGPPSPATDIYALGLTLLECATLQGPHAGADSLPAIMRSVMTGAGTPRLADLRPDLGPALSQVIERALAVQPLQRFRDASELRAAVRDALSGASPAASTGPPPVGMGMGMGMPGQMPMPMAAPMPMPMPIAPAPQAAAAMQGYRTTGAPLVATQPSATAAPTSSPLGIIAIALAALALLIVVAGAAGAVVFLRGQAPAASNAPTAAPSLPGGAAISLPDVGSSEEFDRADATAVPLKNHSAINACAAKSRRFNGKVDVVLDVSSKDGRVIGTSCHTIYPKYDSKHPTLDPEAQPFCSCVQTATATWKFKPPKSQFASPFGDDSESLHVKYICSK